ncbi:unnamed protein product [Amoebophrya sp. A25]|nr:unnamed protein product [Amoebophrya sp. A25]|eukprot:GSA25T00023399001.1
MPSTKRGSWRSRERLRRKWLSSYGPSSKKTRRTRGSGLARGKRQSHQKAKAVARPSL